MNKTLGAAMSQSSPKANQPMAEKIIQSPVEISLDALKNKKTISSKPAQKFASGDRAASSEDMSKLKDLISEKIEEAKVKKEDTPPVSASQKSKTSPVDAPSGIDPRVSQPREVPEDVLRKILE